MKKRVLVSVLCVALLAALLLGSQSAADDKLNFISINDTLPPELINTAVSYGGQIYVPAWLFANYGLGLSYVYFSSASTAYLYSGDLQLFFELSTGKTYDGDDYHYSTPAIFQGGTVYLPLDFVCSFFGMPSYANIGENEYGRVLRITTGAQILTDQEFLRAARNVMRSHYQSYSKVNATPSPSPSPSSSPSPPPPPPVVTETPSHDGDHVRLAMIGLPDTQLLELLRRTKTDACFFLTGEEAYSDPDTVRRLACSGYSLGVHCPGGTRAEYEETAALLMEIARVRTILTYVPAEEPALQGTVPLNWDAALLSGADAFNTAYQLTAQLETMHGDMTLALSCDASCAEAVSVILYYLSGNGFSTSAPRVTAQTSN